jgi:hypothetical protein
MWIIFGTKQAAKRVPGGAQIVRHCDACGESTTFYEKELTETFRLYFVDVLDYRTHRVMQCGACGACYATDELGAHDRDLAGSIGERLEQGAGAIGRAATTVGQEITGLAARVMGRPDPPRARIAPLRVERAPEPRLRRDDPALADDLELRFRALEEEDDRSKRR